MHQVGWAIVVVILAGIIQGSFAAPMKRMPEWHWENSWLVFAFSGLLIFPWIVALSTVPHLSSVFLGASGATLFKVIAFGFAWGIGATLFGLGISRVGLALGFALILGITATFGSLLPLAVLHPEELMAKRGLALIAGTAVMIVGLIFLALAGRQRERDLGTGQSASSGFTLGLVICIFSGIFSSMLNFSFLFGDELRARALDAGASISMAGNPSWALAVTAGFVTNLVYCVYLLRKNGTWAAYGKGPSPQNWLLGFSTGLLWFGGIVLYGMGAAWLGSLGGIVGWPMFMIVVIIAGLFWGAMTGEWKGVSRRAYAYCWIGVAILFLAILVISAGNAA
jgi:L-rhamnose-H+ transport protein